MGSRKSQNITLLDIWKRTERKLQSFDKKKTKSKMSPKIIPLEKNKERKNRKSEEKEKKKSNGCSISCYVDFFGDSFWNRKLFYGGALFWL